MFTPPRSLLVACAAGLLAAPASAEDMLRLWGIDAADSQLFAIDDVNNPDATFTDYGAICIVDGIATRKVDAPIRAFTIVNTFDAYAVASGPVGDTPGPVLLHIDLREIDPGVPVIAEVVGSVADEHWDPSWAVTGIAGDPLFSVMYILAADGNPDTNDRVTRVRMDVDRRVTAGSLGELRWASGAVTMGADIALGPAGLLLVADELSGRIVMLDPETGAIRGVRLEGLRVDSDTAAYAGIAWDGYNDRTAMFDRNTGMLVIDDRTNDSISAFDLRHKGIDDAEGLEFVFRPTPPGQGEGGAATAMRGVSNTPQHDGPGGAGRARAGGGGGGGGSSSPSFEPPLDDLTDPSPEPDPQRPGDTDPSDPFTDLDESFEHPDPPQPRRPGPDEGPPEIPNTPTPGDPPPSPPPIPTPGVTFVIGAGLVIAVRRRR
jgi:hypothetical protein